MAEIPVSVIISTKNEEANIAACLEALTRFDDVWVVDSESSDKTCEIAKAHGAKVEGYRWDGKYPKKRQWCLENLALAQNFVFFVDADEIVTEALVDEIAALDFDAAGYFVQGVYVYDGQVLRHGLRNNKLALFDRRKIEFPEVDDLDIEGMGEIEGHYQPVMKAGYGPGRIEKLRMPLLHYAYNENWEARHLRYARWEAGMNAKNAWPEDPRPLRQALKALFRKAPFRGALAFLHCYVFKLGFLDGRAGYDFARSRARYYALIKKAGISDASKAQASSGGVQKAAPESL